MLELGSGLGQFAITAAQTIPAAHLTVSDFHHQVLNTLHLNINLNLNPTFDLAGLEVGQQ